jgi:hypothetical protein
MCPYCSAARHSGILGPTDESSAQLCVCLSEDVIAGLGSTKSMRLLGQIQGREMLISVDSGSSHSFISTRLAAKLSGISPLQTIMSVQVANGVPLLRESQLLNAQWTAQEFQF